MCEIGTSLATGGELREPLHISAVRNGLRGQIRITGDKSITHRALFFAALNSPSSTTIINASPSEDCQRTLLALTQIGYRNSVPESEIIFLDEREDLVPSDGVLTLDAGNSGTTARLLMGFLCGEHGTFEITGDDSLMRRPMERVASPLRQLGATITTADGSLPVRIYSASRSRGTSLVSPLQARSAQVHASIVLAALRSEIGCRVRREPGMRDHTLRMLSQFGWRAEGESEHEDLILPITSRRDVTVRVPGDISSAAFLIVATILTPNSEICVNDVGLNPTRTAFLESLLRMGADIQWEITSEDYEPAGFIRARYSPSMRGISLDTPGTVVTVREMMDELPLLALVASQAVGRTTVTGAAELRVKESDRLTAMATLLSQLGIAMEILPDGFIIDGPQKIRGGEPVCHSGDHRLCMVAAVAAFIAAEPIVITEPDVAAVSYPAFWDDLAALTSGEEVITQV